MKKDYLLFGGLIVAAVVIFLYLKKQSANQVVYLNEPGLDSQPGIGAVAQNAGSAALSQIIGTAGNALSGLFGNAISSIGSGFSSQSSDGSNSPGLDDEDSYEQSGDDFTTEENNFLDTGVEGLQTSNDYDYDYSTF